MMPRGLSLEEQKARRTRSFRPKPGQFLQQPGLPVRNKGRQKAQDITGFVGSGHQMA